LERDLERDLEMGSTDGINGDVDIGNQISCDAKGSSRGKDGKKKKGSREGSDIAPKSSGSCARGSDGATGTTKGP
jgi:hypothetical protein